MMRGWMMLCLAAFVVTATAQQNVTALRKLSPGLQRQMAAGSSDRYLVSFSIQPRFNTSALPPGSIKLFNHIYSASVSSTDLYRLAANEAVVFINTRHQPKEELTTGAVDYTLNRVTLAHHRYPLIRGEGITVSIKERAFDTADIDFKGRLTPSNISSAVVTPHASLMTTIIAGGGNSSPAAFGAAPEANLASADFANLFPDDAALLQQKASVQNHSYGTVVETFYGNEAAAYDASVVTAPNLLHIFSAGNAGTATAASGIYAGINGIANLTGNFKQSKNTLSVGALDSSGKTMAAASKGPAYDGRIKPELTAYGEDGSSGAAALVSGTAVLLQDAYAKSNTEAIPSVALLKSVLINSADEVGTIGPDYTSGYGSLNAAKAIETITTNRYIQSSLVQNETKGFAINIPANCALLKITLAWTDPAASPNAAKALVNDLDLVVKSSGHQWLPWVLNSVANKDSLEAPSVRKRDTLNNVEQVSIINPTAGSYTIGVTGTTISAGLQSFAISYQIDTAGTFEWTYPTGSDALTSGTTAVVRWRSNITGTGTLQYNNGVSWQSIGPVDLSASQSRWTVPDTLAALRLRILTTAGQTVVTDTFVVSRQPRIDVGFDCGDSVLLYWNRAGSSQYRLFRLGDKYLESFAVTGDTSIILRQPTSSYYAVAPLVDNKAGVQSNTLRYKSAGVGCYFTAFYLQLQSGTTAVFTVELGTLFGVKSIALQRRTSSGYETVQSTNNLTTTSFTLQHNGLLTGENRYRLQLTLLTGRVVYSDVERVFYFSPQAPVQVYPNPALQSGPLQVLSPQPGIYTIRIYNAAGSEIYNQLLMRLATSLPSNRFAKGLYFIHTTDKSGGRWTQKFIVQ